ncbi:hypothetical protein ACGFK1_21685 [Mycobacterium sp. NPDC048908]|uniref:hypothetical protein n=1 Tax=Mycobacterium sp. NPDC048908 TaxID=3364292 RepID=UPI0037100C3A
MSIGDFINDPFGAAGKAMADLAPDSVRETVHEAKETLNDMAQSVVNPTMPDANSVRQTFPDGHTDTMYDDGSRATEFADGSSSAVFADGTRTTTFADGSTSTVNPDGSIIETVASHPDSGAAGDFTDPNFDLGSYASEHGVAGPDLKSAAGIILDDKENWDTNGPTEQPQPSMDSPSSGIIHPDPFADGIAPTAGEQAEGYGAGGEYGDGTSADVFNDAGTLGEVTGPETHSLGENSMQDDYQVDIGPAQIEDPNPIVVDIGPAQEEEPDQTAGEQAQYAGADGYWGTSDYGGSAAEEAAGSGVSAYGPGADPNYSLNPVGEDGPAAPDYGPGATGEVGGGAGGEVTTDDSFF